MVKELVVALVIAITTGLASSVITVATISVKMDWVRSDLNMVKTELNKEIANHENRLIILEHGS